MGEGAGEEYISAKPGEKRMRTGGKTWGVYKLPRVVYTKEDVEKMREKYKRGQKLTITKTLYDKGEQGGAVKARRTYRVIKTYKHHVNCEDAKGIRESFGYLELEKGGRA